jgi:hypothetical protein
VFPARYELNSYIVCRKRLVSKRLNASAQIAQSAVQSGEILRLKMFCG